MPYSLRRKVPCSRINFNNRPGFTHVRAIYTAANTNEKDQSSHAGRDGEGPGTGRISLSKRRRRADPRKWRDFNHMRYDRAARKAIRFLLRRRESDRFGLRRTEGFRELPLVYSGRDYSQSARE